MKIGIALRETYAAEIALAGDLLRIGEVHRTDHDVFHLSRTLSGWCDRHVHRLSAQGERFSTALDQDAVAQTQDRSVVSRLREKASELVGQRPEPALLLLHDLRDLHLAAAHASLAWTVLGQGAQAIRDQELLTTVTACHPETIRTMKWTLQKLKETSPQVLAS